MIRRAVAGLRGRLLAALVFTSAVTLAVAAAITLGPLQSRLRAESATALRQAAFNERLQLERALRTSLTAVDTSVSGRSATTTPARRPSESEIGTATWRSSSSTRWIVRSDVMASSAIDSTSRWLTAVPKSVSYRKLVSGWFSAEVSQGLATSTRAPVRWRSSPARPVSRVSTACAARGGGSLPSLWSVSVWLSGM